MKPMRILCAVLLFTKPVLALDIPVTSEADLKQAVSDAKPGDSLVLRNGEWKDVNIVFVGKGTESAPITLRAQTPGEVVITGKSTFKIGGEHLVIEGLLFKDPDPSISDLIQFRKDSKQLAKNCRMTQCAVVSDHVAERSKEGRWIGLYGEGHRVDHSTFQGKSSKGTTFVVWLGDKNIGGHRIDHNYFGPREELGKNGGETIRIGDSKTSMLPGNCVVESNLFEKCNGEAECISNKSCGNVYRKNTFLQVSGTLTLRHGNACIVEDNCFLGEGAKGTGGIRVIGEDHIVACEHSILIGLSDDKNASLAPIETTFVGNTVLCPKHAVIEARCDLQGVTWADNRFLGKSLGLKTVPPGITVLDSDSAGDLGITPLQPIPREDVGTAW